MVTREFHLRLSCGYEGDQNDVIDLEVQLLHDGEWQDFYLNTTVPGFLTFVYAIFTCQHLYLRSNAAEHGLLLDEGEGRIDLTTSEDWHLLSMDIQFDVRLRAGVATAEAVDNIVARMQHCPVSKNIRVPDHCHTVVNFL